MYSVTRRDPRPRLLQTVDAAVVFGSVARREESAKSDVDVLVLGNNLSSLKINARLNDALQLSTDILSSASERLKENHADLVATS